jgi:hypothetical protein
MGYAAVRDLFRQAASRGRECLDQVIADLEAGAKAWAGDSRQADDRTYAVIRVRQ